MRAREVEKLQAELGDLRKDVHMKEIYIRQLSAHAAGVSRLDELELAMKDNEVFFLLLIFCFSFNFSRFFQTKLAEALAEKERLKADLEHVKYQAQSNVQHISHELDIVRAREAQLTAEVL